jgi:hypothetical protein
MFASHPMPGDGRLMTAGFVRVSGMCRGASSQTRGAQGWTDGECHECDDRQNASHQAL